MQIIAILLTGVAWCFFAVWVITYLICTAGAAFVPGYEIKISNKSFVMFVLTSSWLLFYYHFIY